MARAVLVTVVGLASLVILGCGSGDSGTLSADEAREAVEGIPYEVSIHRPAHGSDILIGVARGRRHGVVHFAMVTDPGNPAVPRYIRRAGEGDETGGGGWNVFKTGEFSGPGESTATFHEQANIAVAIDEALCRAATGEACPV